MSTQQSSSAVWQKVCEVCLFDIRKVKPLFCQIEEHRYLGFLHSSSLKMQFTSQEVEEIIVFEEVEKELESVEKSFESGDMQSFGRNKKDIIDQFDKFRHCDEEVFRHHCDAVIGYLAAQC